MAIINSIALGTLSGKIGNVSTNVTKRKNIARSLPSKTVRTLTPSLAISQKKYRNVYVLYNFLKKSLAGFVVLKNEKESISNCFLRILINRLPYEETMSPNMLFSHLSGLKLYYRKRVWIHAIGHFDGFLRFYVECIPNVVLKNTYINLTLIDKNGSGLKNMDLKIPTSDILLGHFDINYNDYVFTNYLVYLYVKNKSWTSEIFFN